MVRTAIAGVLAVLLLLSCAGFVSAASPTQNKISGQVTKVADGVVTVRIPEPLHEGAVFELRILPSDPIIAKAKMLDCSKESPYVATAKVTHQDPRQAIPIGALAYADPVYSRSSETPKPIGVSIPSDPDRFSIQAGAFYPSTPLLRDTIEDYWQAYRLNYSFLRIKSFESLISAEYIKGSGSQTTDLGNISHKREIVPLSLLGRIKPVSVGSVHMFLGGGAGAYLVRSEDTENGITTSGRQTEFGRELLAGLESRHGWVAELRYRDVPDTEIEGYSLTIGQRF